MVLRKVGRRSAFVHLPRGRLRRQNLAEHAGDLDRLLDATVDLERQPRRVAGLDLVGDLRLQEARGTRQTAKRELLLGRAVVQRTFSISRLGVIAGCRVIGGVIARNARLRVIRDSRVVGDYGIDSLKREKDDAREVRDGLECGIKLAGFNDLKEGDILECYRIEEVARTLS